LVAAKRDPIYCANLGAGDHILRHPDMSGRKKPLSLAVVAA